MFALIRTAVRFFILGAVVGVLIAPRAGRETRQLLTDRFQALVNHLVDLLGLPPIETGPRPVMTVPPSAPAAQPAAAPTAAAPTAAARPRRRPSEPGAGTSAI
jgi:hypothetical protein